MLVGSVAPQRMSSVGCVDHVFDCERVQVAKRLIGRMTPGFVSIANMVLHYGVRIAQVLRIANRVCVRCAMRDRVMIAAPSVIALR